MNEKEAWESLMLKFTSANSNPVQRATIIREEWEAIKYNLLDFLYKEDGFIDKNYESIMDKETDSS